MIEESAEPGTYQFTHALIRETLYDELPATRRARLHLRVGAVLEAIAGGGATLDVAALAHHYCAALPGGDPLKAVQYAQHAAERANQLFAYEEAARYYRFALQASKRTMPPTRSSACGFSSRRRSAHESRQAGARRPRSSKQAAGSAKTCGVAHELARAAQSFEEATWRPGLQGTTAARLLRDALDALGEDESTARAEVLSSLSRALIFSGEVDEGMRMNAEAIAMARRLGDPATLAAALRAGLQARWLPERFAERMATTVEVMRLAREAGHRERELEATSWRLFDLMELGNLQARARPCSNLFARGRRAAPAVLSVHRACRRVRCSRCSRDASRKPRNGRSRRLRSAPACRRLDAAGIYGVQMFSIRREQGRLKELAPLVAHFVRTTPQAATWRPGLALVYTELGMKDEARAEFEALAADRFAAVPRDGLWANCIAYLAEVCSFLGDAEPCRGAVRVPRAVRRTQFRRGSEHRLLGRGGASSRNARGDHAALGGCRASLRGGARDECAAGRAAVARAHALRLCAHVARARPSPKTASGRLALLDEALETARALGMNALAERAQALREAPARQPSREHYPAGLSRREVEVLQLIAAGKGNREIAERLFVSPNTVANHVRSILTKTNAANRTEAAAFALKNALVKE